MCSSLPWLTEVYGGRFCDMSGQVRTTVRLGDSLLDQAKREAARRGQTLTSLIDQGLRLVLARGRGTARRVRLPVCRVGGGTVAGVDLSDTSALLDLMEGRR